ncbi:MAG TPA: PEP-CTERM sorting domain-containing protein [Pyrinomonadaceae bacterium]|nr:PEP-CTERM sorting domain-containing protein [Pyrinomonadaceae bacterium]
MRRQVTRTVAITLSVLLVALPAQAGTVHILDALQGLADGRGRAQGTPAPRLRSVSQTGADVASGVTPASQDGQQAGAGVVAPAQGGADTSTATGAPVSLIAQDAQGGGQVETVDLGDVTGTVCDCGEFENPVIRGGGFPLWPLAGLGAIPLFFIKRDDNPPGSPPPGPTPPPPPPIPEPATLLLLGSGLLALGAGARRRRRQQLGDEATRAEVI